MKKGRTFSFDLPKLKLGAFKYENRPWNDANAMVMEPESPGEVPKSVRPLPNDLEAALRAACTGVLRNNKPSHEYHKGGKAQLDYATIRRGGGNQPAPRKPEPIPTTLSKSTSNEDRAQHPHRESTMMNGGMIPGMSHRMSTMPAVIPATFEPQAHAQAQESNYQVQLQRSRAQSRADQLMAGPPVESQQVQRTRTNSQHSRSQSTPQGFWTAPSPQLISKFGSLRRPKPAPRAQSMETTPAPLHDSAKEYPWSTSPTKATATEQPPQPSHAAPAPPSEGKKENASPVDADWMHDDSERRRLLRQQEFAETALSRHTTWIAPKPEPAQEKQTEKEQEAEKEEEKKTATEQESRTPTLVTKIPERKPVPTAQAVASPMSTSSLSSPTIEFPDEVLRSPSQQSAAVEEFQRVPTMQRSESRNGRERMRGNGVPMNSRAASRARSVTRDVKNFIRNASRNASRTRQPNMRSDDASTRSRSRRPSFSREVANNVKEYFRPGTAVDKQSLDVPRNIANLKSKSHESFVSARSDASPAKDTPMQLSQRSSQHNKNPSGSTGRNSFEVGEESITPRNAAGSEAPQQKRQPDLNRALPPLPRLDSWHVESFIAPSNDAPESPQSALRPPKDPQEPSLPSPTSSTTMKRISSRDSRSPLPSPKIGGVHDFVALRMGAPVSRQASKAKIPHEHGNPNLTHQQQQRSPRPPMSRRAPTDPKDVRTKTPDHGRPSSQVKEKEYQASRRRSKSVQEVNAPDLSEKLRQASANSPDGRPIHAVGQAKLINTTPSRDKLDGFASKIGRKLSTKRRNITPTQNPPVPPPHRELPQRAVKTATSTPDGLSRANSTYHAKRRPDMSRKMSMEESGRPHDSRSFKNNDELMMPPPPVAVGSSKNSPRMGLGNFLPNKFQQQPQSMPQTPQQQQHQQHAQQQSVSKKWWHLGLGNGNDNMDAGSKGGSGMEQTSGGLGVRY